MVGEASRREELEVELARILPVYRGRVIGVEEGGYARLLIHEESNIHTRATWGNANTIRLKAPRLLCGDVIEVVVRIVSEEEEI